MKENIREIIKKEYTTEYEAVDGIIFIDKEECLEYEKSARMVVYAKYVSLVLARKTEYEIYHAGSEEYEIDIVKLKTMEDVDIVLQLYCLYNHCTKEDDRIVTLANRLTSYLQNDDIIFIGRGDYYSRYDSFYIINSLQEVINHITESCNEEES